ncbi:zinc finger protein 883-like [Scomber scombrus]|uniref:zinc finger protein 883-like n=1 Tax=Scomber scombrus TaxID=13677 RepID=UPI002DDA3D3C|nr:zinc finger protein 883-like [Scomber scombrus]
MLSLDTLERQISAVVDTLVAVAVSELRRLLNECSANVVSAQSCTTPAVKTEEECVVAPPEERQQFNRAVTSQFAALLETWTKGAVKKISMILKVSTCEAEGSPAAEQRAGLVDKKKQCSVTQKEGRVSVRKNQVVVRSSRRKIENNRKENDHLHSQAQKQTGEPTVAAADAESVTKPAGIATHEESVSVSPSEPDKRNSEATTTEPASNANKEDVVQEDTDSTSTSTSKMKQMFKCPSCVKTFALKCLMERHYLTHTKPHLCSECGKRFAGLHGLNAHSRRHTGEKIYKCSDCGTKFAYKSTFNRHMRQHSLKRSTTHTCTLCENQFAGVLALQRHRCCALEKTFVCSLCPETFNCRRSLADHENLHPGDRDFICEMCGESFLSSSSLTTHRVTHMQKENYCHVHGLNCGGVLKEHLSKHSGEKLFTCEVCGKGCSHRSALKHHMLTHTGERPYVCETCGKRCGHASALQNHMRIHTGKKAGQQPVCDTCGKKFRCMVNLKYHMSVHTGEKPYACEQCGKKFSNPSNLKVHALIHSGKKMYVCNICGRRFSQSSSLKVHRGIHTGEKPYHCVVCGKAFLHSGDFKKHQRVHLPQETGGQSEKTAVKI